jgi:hypothetical protein
MAAALIRAAVSSAAAAVTHRHRGRRHSRRRPRRCRRQSPAIACTSSRGVPAACRRGDRIAVLLCCGALGRNWHIATFRCDASIRSLSGPKRTFPERRERTAVTRLTRSRHRPDRNSALQRKGSRRIDGGLLFLRRLMPAAASSATAVVMCRPQERRYSSRRLHPRRNRPLPARVDRSRYP